MKHMILILSMSFALSAAAFAQEADTSSDSATLIISNNLNEFIVLRSTATEIVWTADTGESKEYVAKYAGGITGRSGSVDSTINLAEIFERVTSIEDTRPKTPNSSWWRSAYPGGPPSPRLIAQSPAIRLVNSLRLLDSEGVKTCIDLTSEQHNELRRSLRTVFDDVAEKGPYTKRHSMLVFLAQEDEQLQLVRFVEKPAPEEPTREKLQELIGKTEKDSYTRFGLPKNVGFYDFGRPEKDASADEIEKFWEQKPARILVYGDVGVYVNIHGRIIGIREK